MLLILNGLRRLERKGCERVLRRLCRGAWLAGWLLLPAGASAAPAAPALVLAPCKLPGVEHPARCGTLSRPLDPAEPAGRTLELHVAVLPALSRQPLPDPVFFLAGGPGQSAIELAGAAQRRLPRLGNRRDLVLVDLRGTGRSAPLRCPDEGDLLQPLDEAADPARVADRMRRCRDALRALPHGDLRRFTTSIAAQDLDAVRAALGVRRFNLVAGSYGTRLALEVLRQQPQTVRRAVLDGVSPPDQVLPLSFAPDAQAAFDALALWCRDDARCAAQAAPLEARWATLLESLPQKVTVPHPVSGREESLTVTRGLAASLVRAALYAPALAAGLPHALDEAAQGRWTALVGLAGAIGGGLRGGIAQGLHFSVVCAEDMPLLEAAGPPPGPTAAASGAFGPALSDLYRRVCADWPRAAVPPAFYRIAPSPAPVLLLSGGLDPVTPPRHGERVAAALGAKARHWVVPQGGHGVSALRCLQDAVQRFIDVDDEASALALDGGCAQAVPRPPIFVPPGAGARR